MIAPGGRVQLRATVDPSVKAVRWSSAGLGSFIAELTDPHLMITNVAGDRELLIEAPKPPLEPTINLYATDLAAATVTLSFERVTRGRKVGKRCVKAKRSNRRRKACKRYAAVKPALSFANQAAGQRSIRFEGRLNRRKTLKPGIYRLTLRARDRAGNRSAPLPALITVLPRKRKR